MVVKGTKILRRLTVAVILSLVTVLMVAAPVLAAPVIELSPSSGSLGTKVVVSGTNFESYRGDSLSIFFGRNKVDTLIVPEDGAFTAEFVVPDDTEPGRVYVIVEDELGNRLGERRPFIVQETEIELHPKEGAVGTVVTVTGTGFYAGEVVTIYYNGSRADGGTEEASPIGEFTYSFAIPDSTIGEHRVKAEDVLDNSDKAYFNVTPSIALSSSSGPMGDRVTVSGTGFGDESYVTVYFDKAEVARDRSDKYGCFEISFDVPVMKPGSYEVEVEEDDNIDRAGFTIVAGVNLSPSAGNVDTAVTVNGIGFIVDHTVTINYDDVQVATAPTDANGAFSITFRVPASIGGGHTVTVSDGTNVVKRIFAMESEAPPTPALLVPEEGSEAEAEAYFDWEDANDPSGVTYTLHLATDEDFSSIVLEKEGLTSSDYTVAEEEKLSPTKKEAPYYWRVKAIDGASNESGWTGTGSFYVSSRFALSGWAKNALIGLGVAGAVFLGFWLGRRTARSRQNNF
jgi:hypothetical protein